MTDILDDPLFLDLVPTVSGTDVQQEDGVYRSDLAGGPGFAVLAFEGGWDFWNFDFVCDQAQFLHLQWFHKNRAGRGTVTTKIKLVGRNAVLEVHEFRFNGPLSWKLIGHEIWSVSVAAKVKPIDVISALTSDGSDIEWNQWYNGPGKPGGYEMYVAVTSFFDVD